MHLIQWVGGDAKHRLIGKLFTAYLSSALYIALLMVSCVWCSIARAADTVKVYEAARTILTGPFNVKVPPQQRPQEFQPVNYPAVYLENAYLRCCLLPTVGGRLYEVYNKASRTQLFYVNPYLDRSISNYENANPSNLGGVEVNFPYFHHGNTYNDHWQWAKIERKDGVAGVVMGFTSRPMMQRAVFRVMLHPNDARVYLEYQFQNNNCMPWGLAAWIDTMHPKTMDTQFYLPSPWVAQHGHNASRTDLKSWPVRDGIDLSWQKNVPAGMSLSEFAFMPRDHFYGYYDYARDSGAVRLFDPASLPAAKLWTEPPPCSPERYYQHFEMWTATSPVMEDPTRQAEYSACSAADSWFQAWGIGGYVYANENLALNLKRNDDGTVLAGICATRPLPGCVVNLRQGQQTFYRANQNLDPAAPWKKTFTAAPAGDIVFEITAPDGRLLAQYELRTDPLPREEWVMPEKPRWKEGVNSAYYNEDYEMLWRWPNHFNDAAISRYQALCKANPDVVQYSIDLARAYLKDEQVRRREGYSNPESVAEVEVAKRRKADLDAALLLLQEVLRRDANNGYALLYLGITLERQGQPAQANEAYNAAVNNGVSSAAGLLARLLIKEDPDKAIALARQMNMLYPQSPTATQLLIAVLTDCGKVAGGESLARKLYAQDPTDALTTSLLSEALRRRGENREAKKYSSITDKLIAGHAPTAMEVAQELKWLHGAAPTPY